MNGRDDQHVEETGFQASHVTEMTLYDPGVVVQWNPKAYCNAEVMIRWLKHQYKHATQGFITPSTQRLLTLDVFAGQKTDEVKLNSIFQLAPNR